MRETDLDRPGMWSSRRKFLQHKTVFNTAIKNNRIQSIENIVYIFKMSKGSTWMYRPNWTAQANQIQSNWTYNQIENTEEQATNLRTDPYV